MKTKLFALALFFSLNINAQFVQSVNKNYGNKPPKSITDKARDSIAELNKMNAMLSVSDAHELKSLLSKDNLDNLKSELLIANIDKLKKSLKSVNPHHELLGIKDSIIDPYAAALFQKVCIDSINSLSAKRDTLIATRKLNASKKNKHTDAYINKKSLALTASINDYKKARDYFGAINSLDGSPKFYRRFFPLRSVAQAQQFFLNSNNGEKKVSFIKDVTYQNNFDDSNTLNSSILTAVFPFFNRYIPLKINIASTITQSNDTIAEKKVADKVAKGGLFNIGLTYTFFYSNWKYLDNNSIVVYMPIETRFHMDDVKNKSNLTDTFFYNEVSTALYVSFDLLQSNSDTDLATLFFAGKYSWFNGGSKFSEKINDNKFSLFQLNAGLKIANKFTLAINVPLGSSSKSFFDNQTSSLALVFDTGN